MIGDEPRVRVLIGTNSIWRRRLTLDIVCKQVGTYDVKAINKTILEPVVQYCSFGIRRELTLAFVR